MATVSRDLHEQTSLEGPTHEAEELLEQWRSGDAGALERVQRRHKPRGGPNLDDARVAIAREYGVRDWTELGDRIALHDEADQLRAAIQRDQVEVVLKILRERPKLLHLPVWSGNWGPPMSHAANRGHLEIVKAVAGLGARDFQHAFDRAILQGELETARWLRPHVTLDPNLAMGPCETLDADGLRFLIELGVPINNPKALGLVIETYSRRPEGKHAILDLFAEQGLEFPDTAMVAFHRGDVARLAELLKSDPRLIGRRFSLGEIYPAALGCGEGCGMHGTSVDGCTLLHLAIDYDEREIFDLLLENGADANAAAMIDAEGFGGHTPLFNAAVNSATCCGRQRDGAMARELLARGASREARANLRKFMDWVAAPGWHVAKNVTAAEWAATFPERGWVNEEAARQLAEGA